MKVVALLSGGKDSVYNMMECRRLGHEIVALAHLHPPREEEKEEIDSFMFQSIGSNMVEMMVQCMDLPLFTQEIRGTAVQQDLLYQQTTGDEVEDLFELLSSIKSQLPEVEAVCSGAIFSDYQRLRVENVCQRLNLVSLAYLWQREQGPLLDEMIADGMEVILVKVASMGLAPHRHLGKTIAELRPYFHSLHAKYSFHICGEGGEYETITLDCPLFKKRIVIDESQIKIHSDDMFAPVGYLHIASCHLEDKQLANLSVDEPTVDLSTKSPALSAPDQSCPKQRKPSGGVDLEKEAVVHQFKNQYQIVNFTSAPSELTLNSIEEQFTDTFNRLKDCLMDHGLCFADCYFIQIYLQDMQLYPTLNKIYKQYFQKSPASRSCIEVAKLTSLVRVDCFVEKNSGDCPLTFKAYRQILHVQSLSKWAPTCIGPYSQANIMHSSLIFMAGQIGLVPETMQLNQQSRAVEFNQICKNIRQMLCTLQSDFRNIFSGIAFMNNQGIKNEDGSSLYDQIIDIMHQQQTRELQNAVEESAQSSDNEDDTEPLPIEMFPVLLMSIDGLPRNAGMEMEIIAFTTLALQALAPQILSIEHQSPELIYHGTYGFSDRTFLSCLLASKRKQLDLPGYISALITQVQSVMVQANLPWESMMIVRLFYRLDLYHEDELYQGFKAHSIQLPLIQLIPVQQILPSYDFALQLVAYDFQKMNTDLWLKKRI